MRVCIVGILVFSIFMEQFGYCWWKGISEWFHLETFPRTTQGEKM